MFHCFLFYCCIPKCCANIPQQQDSIAPSKFLQFLYNILLTILYIDICSSESRLVPKSIEALQIETDLMTYINRLYSDQIVHSWGLHLSLYYKDSVCKRYRPLLYCPCRCAGPSAFTLVIYVIKSVSIYIFSTHQLCAPDMKQALINRTSC